jgi:uncharacterized protein (DUF488 family)
MYIYTLGYERLHPDLYIKALIDSGVKLVIDVRENPWSQRPAYVGGTLRRTLSDVGIGYDHWKWLGNPAANRKTARTAAECMKRYRHYLNHNRRVLDLLVDQIRLAWDDGCRICLTCYERDPANCHRSVIVEELQVEAPSLSPIHLTPSIQQSAPSAKRPEPSLTTTASLAPGSLQFDS